MRTDHIKRVIRLRTVSNALLSERMTRKEETKSVYFCSSSNIVCSVLSVSFNRDKSFVVTSLSFKAQRKRFLVVSDPALTGKACSISISSASAVEIASCRGDKAMPKGSGSLPSTKLFNRRKR